MSSKEQRTQIVRRSDATQPTRLQLLAAELPSIVKSEQLRRTNAKKLIEAFFYTPPFEQQALQVSSRVESMTASPTTERTNTSNFTSDFSSDFKFEDFMKIPDEGENTEQQKNGKVKRFTRPITKLLHPDAQNVVANRVFQDEEKVALYSSAVEASERQDLETAQNIFLQVMPPYYQELISQQLTEGLSMDEIVQAYPDIVPDLELAKYLPYVQLSRTENIHLNNDDTAQDIDGMVKGIKRKRDIMARPNGFTFLNHSVNSLLEYCENNGIDPTQTARVADIRELSIEAGVLFGFISDYEQLHTDILDNEKIQELNNGLNAQILELPLDVLEIAKRITGKGFPRSVETSEEVFEKLENKLESVVSSTRTYIKDFDVAETSQSSEISTELQEAMQNVLADNEEVHLKNGTTVKNSKEETGLYDTLIRWADRPAEGKVSAYTQHDYIFIDEMWWYRKDVAEMSMDRGSRKPEIDFEDLWDRFDLNIYNLAEQQELSFEETSNASKARKHGFNPASEQELQEALNKLTPLKITL